MNSIFVLMLLHSFCEFVISKEWIDTSDMADPRILKNRHRFSSNLYKSSDDQIAYKEIKIVYKNVESNNVYLPKNPFPSDDESCIAESHQLENANKLEDKSMNSKCVPSKNSNLLEDQNRLDHYRTIENNQLDTSTKQSNQPIIHYEVHHHPPSNEKDHFDQNQTIVLDSCLKKNKELTEDLVCLRNLKSLYTRYFKKFSDIIDLMRERKQKIEIHPYSQEFFILIQVLEHKNCLS